VEKEIAKVRGGKPEILVDRDRKGFLR